MLLSPLSFVSPAKGMSGPECGWAILLIFSVITLKQKELGGISELLQTSCRGLTPCSVQLGREAPSRALVRITGRSEVTKAGLRRTWEEVSHHPSSSSCCRELALSPAPGFSEVADAPSVTRKDSNYTHSYPGLTSPSLCTSVSAWAGNKLSCL